MIDHHLIRAVAPVLTRCAGGLRRLGATADGVTVAGFLVGLGAVPLLAMGRPLAALGCILLNRLGDGLDGALARLSEPTDRGGFLDICLDFLFYASIPFGFALLDPGRNALPAAALLLGFMGTGSTFLAFAILAAKRGQTSAAFPQKGFYYLGGLTEGAETFALFVAACLFPAWFPALAWSFAGLCALTTLTRLHAGWVAFGSIPGDAR